MKKMQLSKGNLFMSNYNKNDLKDILIKDIQKYKELLSLNIISQFEYDNYIKELEKNYNFDITELENKTIKSNDIKK